jgi:DNA-binding transcriptional regulator YhcF (GntR family)
MISPQSGGSLYAQLAARLRDDITTGQLRPGQRIPSETTLQQQYGVARETVRRAVAVLRSEGLVTAVRGHGVVVKETSEVQILVPPAGATVAARMPTTAERAEHDLEDGVPVFVVTGPGGTVEVYPADRWQLRIGGPLGDTRGIHRGSKPPNDPKVN